MGHKPQACECQDRGSDGCNYSVRTPLFKPTELRDASAFNEDFEKDVVNPSWQIGYKSRGVFLVKMDTTQGAENSKHSLKIDFDSS